MKTVTISEDEYYGLLEDKDLLEALFRAGVDEWDGYEYALDLLGEEEND